MNQKNKKLITDSLINTVYCIYDTVLKQYEPPFCVPECHIVNYMNTMINDLHSKFYGRESDYILYEIGWFNDDNAVIEQDDIKRLCSLDNFIDNSQRTLQQILQTLNFLPTGYYKMPEDRKQDIQNRIDEAIEKYVANYVIPDLDTSKLDLQSQELKDIINKSLSS